VNQIWPGYTFKLQPEYKNATFETAKFKKSATSLLGAGIVFVVSLQCNIIDSCTIANQILNKAELCQ